MTERILFHTYILNIKTKSFVNFSTFKYIHHQKLFLAILKKGIHTLNISRFASLTCILEISMLDLFVFPVDEGHGMNIATVMNMIDESLKKYDVDTRSCMARTMCNQYAERMIEGEEEAVQRIGRGIVENIAR